MNKILVVADYTEQNPIAIKQAVNLAKAYNASLEIVYFCYEMLQDMPGDHEEIKSQIMAKVELGANEQFKQVETNDIEYNRTFVWEKEIALWVKKYAKEEQPVLIIKTGHRSETIFYTPTDWQLIRECRTPTLLVTEEKWRKSPNVLAAIDLGTKIKEKRILNKEILREAKRLAEHLGSEVYVSYTPHCSPILRDLGLQNRDEMEQEAKDKYYNLIADLGCEFGIPMAHFDVHAGLPENVIPSTAAKYKAGVVVVGTLGRTGIAGKLMGNTAEKILKLLKTDVLALKPQKRQ